MLSCQQNPNVRILLHVRRPFEARAFSGVVIVEAWHPGNVSPVYYHTKTLQGTSGHAAVIVAAETAVIDTRLKGADPE